MVRFENVPSRRPLFGQLLWFLCWVGLTGVAAWLNPDPHLHGTHTQLGLPPCLSVVLFGRPCPGCGMTTSISNLVHGHFVDAFRAHPFGPPMYLLYTLSAGAAFWAWIKSKRMDAETRTVNALLISLMAAFLLFGAVRFATTTGLQWTYEPPAVKKRRASVN